MKNKITLIQTAFFRIFILSFCFLSLNTKTLQAQKYKIKKVVIDAGHGGKDPGAIGKISKEKDLALAIALKIGSQIELNCPGIEVSYTRKTDVFIPLDDRASFANKIGADLFISVHINAHTSPLLKGTATYSVGLNRVEENLDVTKRENSAILIEENYKTRYDGYHPDDPESHIIFSLLQNANQENSLLLSQKVQNQYANFANRINKGVKQGGLIVLWKTSMPGILTEVGYISNPDEEKFMNSLKGQTLLAMSVFKAFVQYKKIVESRSNAKTNYKHKKEIHISEEENKSKTKKLNNTETKKQIEQQTVKLNTKQNSKQKETLYFSIQLKSSIEKISLTSKSFKGLNISEIKQDALYVYITGKKETPDEIGILQKTIRQKFKDAFAIGVKNGQKIAFKTALKEYQSNNTK